LSLCSHNHNTHLARKSHLSSCINNDFTFPVQYREKNIVGQVECTGHGLFLPEHFYICRNILNISYAKFREDYGSF